MYLGTKRLATYVHVPTPHSFNRFYKRKLHTNAPKREGITNHQSPIHKFQRFNISHVHSFKRKQLVTITILITFQKDSRGLRLEAMEDDCKKIFELVERRMTKCVGFSTGG